MTPHAEQQTQMDAQGPDISPGLTGDPKDAQVAVIVEFNELALVDGAHAELALDGGNERGSLE